MAHENIVTYLTLFTRRLVRRVLPNTTLTDDAVNQIVTGYFTNSNLEKLSVFAVGGLYFKLFSTMKLDVQRNCRRYTFDSMKRYMFHAITTRVQSAESHNALESEDAKLSKLFLDYLEQLTGSIILNHALKDATAHFPAIVLSEVCDEHSSELKTYYGKRFVTRASEALRCGGAQSYLLDKAIEIGVGKRRIEMDFPIDASIPKGCTQDVVTAFMSYGDSYIRKIIVGDPADLVQSSAVAASITAIFPKCFFG